MDALRISSFNIVSVLTTTGFGLGDFGTWGPLTSIIFIILLALGACSGSTAGGLKIFRVQVAFALFKKQMRQLMHPPPSSPEVQRPSGQRRHHPLDDLLRAGLLRHHPADRRPARRHRAGP
jgi:Trk-type K+ transport system membrane component